MMFHKILCPVDFSEPSRFALRTASRLAKECGAELVVAHVWEAPLHPEYSEGILHNELLAPTLKEQETALEDLRQDAVRSGAPRVTAKLMFGVPWHAIAAESRNDTSYDLIVIGTHGRTGIKHVLLGSVAERVARHASCPVMLVRERPV